MTSTPALPTPRPPLRFVMMVAVLVCTAYLSVFFADSHRLTISMVTDAMANTVALAVVALGVRWFTERLTWAHAGAWWFLPAHVVAALLAAQLSLVCTAIMLGLSAWTQTGDLGLTWLAGRALDWQLFTGVFAYAAVAGGCYGLQVFAVAREAEALRHEAELARLRARLDPHVLLNTLHSLVELVRGQDAAAEEAIERFGRLVRYVSAPRGASGDLVALREEWEHLEDYLHLEQLRLGTRLRVELQLDDAAAASRIPAVTLQPIVENAIVHGIGPRPGSGLVTVRAAQDAGAVCITITDDGVGASQPAIPGAGTGLSLVQARLAAHFGNQARMIWGATEAPAGWQVTLRVPA